MKRFTETDKWRDPWFQGLPVNSKVLFLYLTDNCNNAGFIEENPRMASFELGISEVEYEGALKGLGRGIKGASGWLWVRRFLRHQKNEPLNPLNPAHRQIARLITDQLGRFDGMPEFQELVELLAPFSQGASKGLPSPIGTGTGKKKGSTEGKKQTLTALNGLIDSEWIASLKADPTYKGINVDQELGRMNNWCKIRGLTTTRRRFINWLNRTDKPLTTKGDYPKEWSQKQIREYEEAQRKYG